MKWFLFSILLIIVGCNKADKNLISFDLSQRLNSKSYQKAGNLKLTVIEEVRLEEDILLNSYPSLFYVSDSLFGIVDWKRILFVHRESGRLFSEISHIGRGPSEYLYPQVVTVRDTIVAISDNPELGKVVFYSLKGEFLSVKKIPTNSLFQFFGSGQYALTYNNYANNSLDLFADDDKHIRGSKIESGPQITGNAYLTLLSTANNEYILKPALRDTIFRVSIHGDEPWIVLNKGQYLMPDEYYDTWANYSNNKDRYINLENVHIAGNHAFVSFQYGREEHHEIWDIEKEELVFKSAQGEEVISSFGPLIESSDGAIPFWPLFVSGKDMFSIFGEESPRIIRVRMK